MVYHVEMSAGLLEVVWAENVFLCCGLEGYMVVKIG